MAMQKLVIELFLYLDRINRVIGAVAERIKNLDTKI